MGATAITRAGRIPLEHFSSDLCESFVDHEPLVINFPSVRLHYVLCARCGFRQWVRDRRFIPRSEAYPLLRQIRR